MDNTVSKDTTGDRLTGLETGAPNERAAYIKWLQRASYPGTAIALAELILVIFHLTIYPLPLSIYFTVGSVAFLAGSILAYTWAYNVQDAAGTANDLYVPQANEKLTMSVFIVGLLLAGSTVVFTTNLFFQGNYTVDMINAWKDTQSWAEDWEDTPIDSLVSFIQLSYFLFHAFLVAQFFYFLLIARAAFKHLTPGSAPMTYLNFLAAFLLLVFGLSLIWFADLNDDYINYPAIKANFPNWITTGLFWTGIFVTALSFIGFVVNHRNYRIGFFALSVLLLISVVTLVNFTGFAYRHARHVDNYYRGTNCANAVQLIHRDGLEAAGCPNKYVSGECSSTWLGENWEDGKDGERALRAAAGLTNTQRHLQETEVHKSCINSACCGIVGQAYSSDLLAMANFGLLTTVAACLLSVGCYYFWYVSWADTHREPKHDFAWLGLMVTAVVVFIIFALAYDGTTVVEWVNENGKHINSF